MKEQKDPQLLMQPVSELLAAVKRLIGRKLEVQCDVPKRSRQHWVVKDSIDRSASFPDPYVALVLQISELLLVCWYNSPCKAAGAFSWCLTSTPRSLKVSTLTFR